MKIEKEKMKKIKNMWDEIQKSEEKYDKGKEY